MSPPRTRTSSPSSAPATRRGGPSSHPASAREIRHPHRRPGGGDRAARPPTTGGATPPPNRPSAPSSTATTALRVESSERAPGPRANGYWEVEVARAGTYRFELRSGLREAGHGLADGIPGDPRPYTDAIATGYGGGRALPIHRASIRVGPASAAQEIDPTAPAAVFTSTSPPAPPTSKPPSPAPPASPSAPTTSTPRYVAPDLTARDQDVR